MPQTKQPIKFCGYTRDGLAVYGEPDGTAAVAILHPSAAGLVAKLADLLADVLALRPDGAEVANWQQDVPGALEDMLGSLTRAMEADMEPMSADERAYDNVRQMVDRRSKAS